MLKSHVQPTPQLQRKAQKGGDIRLTKDSSSFMDNHQDNGMHLEGGWKVLTLGKLWEAMDNAILSQYPLNPTKVRNICRDLMETQTLYKDPIVAKLGDHIELVGGRHRLEAIKLWIVCSGLNMADHKKQSVRVLMYNARSKEDLANHIKRDNESRNMAKSEVGTVNVASQGFGTSTVEEVYDNREHLGTKANARFSNACAHLLKALKLHDAVPEELTVDTCFRIGSTFGRQIYKETDGTDARSALLGKLELIGALFVDHLEDAIWEARNAGRTNLARTSGLEAGFPLILSHLKHQWHKTQ